MRYPDLSTLACGLPLALLAACHSDDDGTGGSPSVYSGVVRLPLGSGLAPAPDGTAVELAPIDAQGDLGAARASTTTVGGAFTLVVRGAAPTSELALVAGSGAQRLRALAADLETDIDPFREASVRLALEQGVELVRFTADELHDLAGSIELVAVVREVAIDADREATAARLRAAALAEPGFAAFLAAAAGAGQTARGPGDLGDHFPLRQDDLWGYRWSYEQSGLVSAEGTRERRTLLPVGSAWEVRTRAALDEGSAFLERFEASERDVRRFDAEDFDALLGGVPDVRLAFPLRPGKTWLALETRGASLGRDVDFDQVFESVDARMLRTVAGFEDVVTPDGTFADCVRVDGSAELLVHPTGGGGARPGTLALTEWYAAGLGLVRRRASLEVSSSFLFDVHEELLSARRIAGLGHGVLPPVVLEHDLGTESLTNPCSASDGTNHLLVVVREHGDERPLLGLLVDSQGDVLGETELRRLTPRTFSGGFQDVAVTFDGTSFVVAHVDQRLIWVQRVSTNGELLDPLPIQITEPHDGGDFGLALASDGTQTLLVWHHTEPFDDGELRACFVTPGGSSLGAFPLLDEVPAGSPALGYGGGSYLLAFQGTSDVVATRLAPDGAVLDPEPIPLGASIGPFVPEIALAFDGTNWLAAWTQKAGDVFDPTQHLLARRITPAGELLEPFGQPPLAICTSFAGKGTPALAFDGTNWLAAWIKTTRPTAIHLARVTPDGERLDGSSADDGRTILGPFGPSHGNSLAKTILSRAGDHVLLHWLQVPATGEGLGRAESATIHALD